MRKHILDKSCRSLSRLREVAKVLDVPVSELFKSVSADKNISGDLECDGKIVKVDSIDAIKKFLANVEAE